MMDRALRVGVMLGSYSVAAWEAKILRGIAASGFAELALLIVDDRPMRRGRQWSTLLYELYVRADRKRHRHLVPDAFASVDLTAELANVPALAVEEESFTVDDLHAIREAELDVLFCLGSRTLDGPILEAARYGVWSYPHGEAPFFRELDRREPVSETVLQALGEEPDSRRVLYRSWSATKTSLHRTSNASCWKMAEFVLRRLRDLQRDGALEALPQGAQNAACKTPRTAAMLRFLARQAWSSLARRLSERRYDEQWQIAVRERREATAPFDRASVRLLVPPRDRFYADVMLFERDGRTWLFFEDAMLPLTGTKGVISAAELLSDGFGPARVVLERPYHLSYPFVFVDGGEVFMVPETQEHGTIELYRAVDFPDVWELDSVLMEHVRAIDATLLRHDGRWWMFVNLACEGASPNDELHLFHSDALRGPWQEYASNPVVSDVRRARPAGPLFIDERGHLIRPGQDSSVTYGHAVVLNHVERLTPREYSETPVGRIDPSWMPDAVALHTYSRGERFEAVDVRMRVRKGARP